MSNWCPYCGHGYPMVRDDREKMERQLIRAQIAGVKQVKLPSELAQHKQVIAEMVQALEVFTQPVFQKELGGNVQGDDSIVFARNDSVLTIGDFKRAAIARAKALEVA